MATFLNQASLSFNGVLTNSNVVVGEFRESLSGTKTAMSDSYNADCAVTYILNIVNAGTTPYNNLTVTDDLGAYTFCGAPRYPLTYVTGSAKYFVDGAEQPAPSICDTQPLIFTGVNVPADAHVTLMYQARINSFAPLTLGSAITNTAVVSRGGGRTELFSMSETILADAAPDLHITKTMCPEEVDGNGRLTYTFIIQNTGAAPAVPADCAVLRDVFCPALNCLSVTCNGMPWCSPANYDYDAATGEFVSAAGQITVPAAIFSQNQLTGEWTSTPGSSTIVVTGTV